MGILHWLVQTAGWCLLTLGATYLAFQAGRRKECGLWEHWYEQQQAVERIERQARERERSVTLSTVQFRRD